MSERPWWKIHSTGKRWLDVVAVVLILIVAAVFLYPVFAPIPKPQPNSKSALTVVGWRMEDYLSQHDGRFPDAAHWMTELGFKGESSRLVSRRGGEVGLAFFYPLSGKRREDLKDAAKVPLVFTSTLTSNNARSGLDTVRWLGDEEKYTYVLFADGSVEKLPYEWRFETIVLEVEK